MPHSHQFLNGCCVTLKSISCKCRLFWRRRFGDWASISVDGWIRSPRIRWLLLLDLDICGLKGLLSELKLLLLIERLLVVVATAMLGMIWTYNSLSSCLVAALVSSSIACSCAATSSLLRHVSISMMILGSCSSGWRWCIWWSCCFCSSCVVEAGDVFSCASNTVVASLRQTLNLSTMIEF